jgi:DDE superfamily endonuclease
VDPAASVAALEVATGKITADACYSRHRHQEFLRFLKKVAAAHPAVDLHVILDNYGTHKHAEVRRWLARPENQRITLHFTRTRDADELLAKITPSKNGNLAR